MKLLIDMNLSPRWEEALAGHGVEATHWSTIGDARAADVEILTYARANGYVVLTHDLDFGAILAATGFQSPSVIQLRSFDVDEAEAVEPVEIALRQFADELEAGALLTVDTRRTRVSILPLRQR